MATQKPVVVAKKAKEVRSVRSLKNPLFKARANNFKKGSQVTRTSVLTVIDEIEEEIGSDPMVTALSVQLNEHRMHIDEDAQEVECFNATNGLIGVSPLALHPLWTSL